MKKALILSKKIHRQTVYRSRENSGNYTKIAPSLGRGLKRKTPDQVGGDKNVNFVPEQVRDKLRRKSYYLARSR